MTDTENNPQYKIEADEIDMDREVSPQEFAEFIEHLLKEI